ncbi:MAG TPA: hypothetical protein VGR54_09385 [Nitrosopumilaceae archaeon]|nr:hypothetical protein [Nitrosopumilaceae archaeon]
MAQQILYENGSANSDLAKRLLQTLAINSGEKGKTWVWIKFKRSNVAHEEWLTHKQYEFLKTLDCVEVCRVSSYLHD